MIKTKKTLSLLLAICMLLSVVPMMGITVSAEEAEWLPVTFKNGGWTQCNSTCEYRIFADGTMTIRPTNGTSGELPSDPSEDYGYTQISWCWETSHTDNEDVVKKVIFENGVKAGNTLYYLFLNFTSLESIDFSGLDTTNTKNMAWMLGSCSSLESVTFGENFNTSNVTTMYAMFGGCQALTTLDLSRFNTSSVTSMGVMFDNCAALTELDVKNFNTSSVTDMGFMFEYCSTLEKLDLSSFDTSNVEYMPGMFNECQTLNELDLSSFDTSNAEDMAWMFCDCSNLTELNLLGFDTATVSDMSSMFENCTNLKTIYASDAWTAEQLNSDNGQDYNMFSGCTTIVGGNGTTFDSNNINKEYAHIDAEGYPGYLTKGFNITNGTKEENKATNNGYISVAKVAAAKATVTVTATPADGYMLDTLVYNDGENNTPITKDGDGNYTFAMPAKNITVTATFTKIPEASKEIETENNITVSDDANTAIQNYIDTQKSTLTNDTTYKFAVKEQVPEDDTKKTAIETIAKVDATDVDNKRIITFLDATFTKTEVINNEAQTPEEITDTGDTVLSFTYNYDMTGKVNLCVYRYHGEEATALTKVDTTDNPADGTFYVSGTGADTKITIFASKFSAYAAAATQIGFTTESYSDSGFYGPSHDDSPKTGVMAFSAQVANIEDYAEGEIKGFGMYIYGENQSLDDLEDIVDYCPQSTEGAEIAKLIANDGWFYGYIDGIASSNFGKTVYCVPYLIIDGEIVIQQGFTLECSVSGDASQYLGKTSPFATAQ